MIHQFNKAISIQSQSNEYITTFSNANVIFYVACEIYAKCQKQMSTREI